MEELFKELFNKFGYFSKTKFKQYYSIIENNQELDELNDIIAHICLHFKKDFVIEGFNNLIICPPDYIKVVDCPKSEIVIDNVKPELKRIRCKYLNSGNLNDMLLYEIDYSYLPNLEVLELCNGINNFVFDCDTNIKSLILNNNILEPVFVGDMNVIINKPLESLKIINYDNIKLNAPITNLILKYDNKDNDLKIKRKDKIKNLILINNFSYVIIDKDINDIINVIDLNL